MSLRLRYQAKKRNLTLIIGASTDVVIMPTYIIFSLLYFAASRLRQSRKYHNIQFSRSTFAYVMNKFGK